MQHVIRAILVSLVSGLVGAGLIGSSAAAQTSPDRIGILLGSHHFGADSDFEEFNPGVLLTWERDLDWTLGAYRNSYGRTSAVAAVGRNFPFYRQVEVGVFGGVAWYPDDGREQAVHLGDVVPIGGLQARAGPLFVQVIPAFGLGADGIVAGGVTFPLD